MNDLTLYNQVKDKMQTGDPIQWRSNSVLGYGIRKVTAKDRRQYEVDNDIDVNHTAGVIRLKEYEEGRRFISESLEKGPELHYLSERLESFDGQVWWYPLTISNEQRTKWGSLALGCTVKAIKYGYWDIFKYAMFGPGKIDIDDGLYCSEEWMWNMGYRGDSKSPNGLTTLKEFENVIPVRIL